MTPNDLLATAYATGKKLVHFMVDDLTDDELLYQPSVGANCAAWIIGHLTLTFRNGLRRAGIADLPEFPHDLLGAFTTTKQPAGEQGGYGDLKELIARFDAHADRMVEWVKTLSADALAAPTDGRTPFATNFAEAVQFGAMHVAMHVGQISAIRRSLGKPPKV